MLRHWGTASSLLLLVLSFTPPARADAVPPPPEHCPAGTVGVTSHGGPRCEKEAPTNCPNGWRGMIGGDCVLWLCSDDAQCQSEGKVCRQLSMCYEPRQRTTTCSSDDRRRPGPEFAMPAAPEPCEPLPAPVTDWIPVNVCGGASSCASPSECRPGALCVAPNAPAPAPQPRGPSGAVAPKPSGCGAGCVGAARGRAPDAALFAAFALTLFVAARRRRR